MDPRSDDANEEGVQSLFNEEERSDCSDKRPVESETLVDRLSALPVAILLHILSLLPMHEVVRTSSLSKNWQYLWFTVPNLIFTNHRSPYRASHFVRFVDKTLILCRHSKVYKFLVNFEYHFQFASHVDLWIRFATSCDVEELFIYFSLSLAISQQVRKIGIYTLPQHTFICSSLTNLKLRCCIVVPNRLITWKSLRNLWLMTSDVSDDAIRNILSGSPLLEVLELDCCRGFNRLHIDSTSLRKLIINGYWCYSDEQESILEISAPNLHSLEITGNLKQRRCRLVNVLSLVDANLSFHCTASDQDIEAYQNMFDELLHSLNYVKELTLGYKCIRVISMLELKHWPSLSKCKCLRLNTSDVTTDSPGLEDLLQSSLDLEALIIDKSFSSNSEWLRARSVKSDDLRKYWTSREQIIFPCLRRHLKTVKIAGFNGSDLERVLPFLEFLLKNACVLEKMVISTRNIGDKHLSYASKELSEVAQKLLNYPRSSRNAVVMFTK